MEKHIVVIYLFIKKNDYHPALALIHHNQF